jgi:hypothetical protein
MMLKGRRFVKWLRNWLELAGQSFRPLPVGVDGATGQVGRVDDVASTQEGVIQGERLDVKDIGCQRKLVG